jgi:hypothetical protein
LACDQIAGSGTVAPIATPEADLRKSRRFIGGLQRVQERHALEQASQGLCQTLTVPLPAIKPLTWLTDTGRAAAVARGGAQKSIAYKRIKLLNK